MGLAQFHALYAVLWSLARRDKRGRLSGPSSVWGGGICLRSLGCGSLPDHISVNPEGGGHSEEEIIKQLVVKEDCNIKCQTADSEAAWFMACLLASEALTYIHRPLRARGLV